MSDPLHVSMARSLLGKRLADPGGPAMLRDAREGLIEGRWGDDYIDALGQDGRHGRGSWPLEQVEAFAVLHSMVYSGRVASICIGTGAKPLRDSEREVNAAALSRLVGSQQDVGAPHRPRHVGRALAVRLRPAPAHGEPRRDKHDRLPRRRVHGQGARTPDIAASHLLWCATKGSK